MEGINNELVMLTSYQNPNAMSMGSLTEGSSFPFFKKRSGLNSRGSG